MADVDASEIFVIKIQDLLSSDHFDEALTEVLNPEIEHVLKDSSMSLIACAGDKLNAVLIDSEDGERAFDAFTLQSMLDCLFKSCKPKESLLVVLELLERADSSEFFCLMCSYLKSNLVLCDNIKQLLLMAFDVLLQYVAKLPLPDEALFSSECIDNCKEISCLENCINAVLDFCEPFVSEAKECRIKTVDERREQALILSAFVVGLFNQKLVSCCSIGEDQKTMPQFVNCLKRCLSTLFFLMPNFLNEILCDGPSVTVFGRAIAELEFLKENEGMLGIGAIIYLVYARGLHTESISCVYSHYFLFEATLKCVNAMLNSPCLATNVIGATLSRHFVLLFWDVGPLPKEALEPSVQQLLYALIMSMTFNRTEKTRRAAFATFEKLYHRFGFEGRLAMTRFVFEHPRNSDMNGIKGHLIDLYRKQLFSLAQRCSTLTQFETSDALMALPSLLSVFLYLDEKEATDILANYNTIMASLNLLLYVAMLQKNGQLRFRNWECINKQFTEPLQRGLELSVAHYELDLKNLQNDGLSRPKLLSDFDVQKKKNVLRSALNTFDLIRSVLCRVVEVVMSFK